MGWFENDRTFQPVTLWDITDAVNHGRLKLPLYQRDIVWGEGRVCALWDSLLRGFPLPLFLLVAGSRDFSRDLQRDAHTPQGYSVSVDHPYYDVLDGQQRVAAIDAVTGYVDEASASEKRPTAGIRLWVDLAPPKDAHPLSFKYWIHACTKVFPFGFANSAGGEFDFRTLTDNTINTIWSAVRSDDHLGNSAFHEMSLDRTFPWAAACPVPLDALTEMARHAADTHAGREACCDGIRKLAARHTRRRRRLKGDGPGPDDGVLMQVAEGLLRLNRCRLMFQQIRLPSIGDDAGDRDDQLTVFERIGRSGMQITQRQLAVSRLMLELGQDGNDAIAAFQQSATLRHWLDTEDIVHAVARASLHQVMKASDRDLGFSLWQPGFDAAGNIVTQETIPETIPRPGTALTLAARNLVLNGAHESRLNDVMLMWNQREAMEHFFGDTDYLPALYSKGRPFDKDHIAARNRFLNSPHDTILGDDTVKNAAEALLANDTVQSALQSLRGRVTPEQVKLSGWYFRIRYSSNLANYRYWPKRLNRHDSDDRIAEKMHIDRVSASVAGHPLAAKIADEAALWRWSAIPAEDISLWRRITPERENGVWDTGDIVRFVEACLKREHWLYGNCHRFVMSGPS